jgi:hypothetical protein
MATKVKITLHGTKLTFTTWINTHYTFDQLQQDAVARWKIQSKCHIINQNGNILLGNVLKQLHSQSQSQSNIPFQVYLRLGDLPTSSFTATSASSPSSFLPVQLDTKQSEDNFETSVRTPKRNTLRTPSNNKRPSSTPTTNHSNNQNEELLRSPPNIVPEHSLGQADELWSIFVCYSVRSSGDDLQMQERPFKTFCRHCGLHLLPTNTCIPDEEAAVVYQRHTNGSHKMSFEQFLDALADLAFRSNEECNDNSKKKNIIKKSNTTKKDIDVTSPPPLPHIVLGVFLVKHVLSNANRIPWGPTDIEWSTRCKL